jgi:hypothetical protein
MTMHGFERKLKITATSELHIISDCTRKWKSNNVLPVSNMYDLVYFFLGTFNWQNVAQI